MNSLRPLTYRRLEHWAACSLWRRARRSEKKDLRQPTVSLLMGWGLLEKCLNLDAFSSQFLCCFFVDEFAESVRGHVRGVEDLDLVVRVTEHLKGH